MIEVLYSPDNLQCESQGSIVGQGSHIAQVGRSVQYFHCSDCLLFCFWRPADSAQAP